MPILSLIIPTHERFGYAKEAVAAILAIQDDIELIVSDTSVDDQWAAELSRHHGRNLRILRPGTGISVVDNFNHALAHATGDYVCFIGDDDFVSTEIVDVVRLAQAHGIDAVRPTFPLLFYWPDYLHRSQPDAYRGTVWASYYTGAITPLDSFAALRRAAERLGRGVFDMPRAYCGLVSRALVDRIIARHGALFGGVSPDIYSAALISVHAENPVQIDFPIVVPGASGASTAGQSAAGRHVGGLRDNPHIGAFRDLVWHPFVPEFYSVPTVWSYSLVRAVEAMPSGARPQLNWTRLFAQCLLYHPGFLRETWRSMRAYARATSEAKALAGIALGIGAEIGWAWRRIGNRLAVRNRTTSDRRIADTNDIAAASTVVSDLIAAGPRPKLSLRP